MKLTSFIVVGARKTATNSLYEYLNQHPQIYVHPSFRRMSFFATNRRARHDFKKTNTFDDYSALCQQAPDGRIIGEISCCYLFDRLSAKIIKHYLPDVKIIAILRNPAERAYSEYIMNVRDAKERRDFADVVYVDDYYVELGFYYDQLKRYFDIFDRKRIKIYLFEEFWQRPAEFLRDLFKFVGVDDTFAPDISKRYNVGNVPKNKKINAFLHADNPVRAAAANILKVVMPLEKRQQIRRRLIQLNSKNILPSLDPALRRGLIDMYRDDILKLQKLIDRDLSAWLK